MDWKLEVVVIAVTDVEGQVLQDRVTPEALGHVTECDDAVAPSLRRILERLSLVVRRHWHPRLLPQL